MYVSVNVGCRPQSDGLLSSGAEAQSASPRSA